MTYKKWEKQLKNRLSSLSKEERSGILDYYYELYRDKLDTGVWEEQIVQEFGSPEVCAQRILSETDNLPNRTLSRRSSLPVLEIVGLVALTLLIIVPIFSGLLSVFASFTAVALVGIILALVGALYVPICFFIGLASWGAIIAHIGTGIFVCGLGVLIAVGFWLAAKYTAIGSVKIFKFIYKRR